MGNDERRHADDAPHRQGAGVAGRRADRSGARPVSPRPRGGAAGRARGGAPALLRGAHPGQGQALPHLGTGPAPRRGASARHSLPLPSRASLRASSRSGGRRRCGRRTGAGQRDGATAGPGQRSRASRSSSLDTAPSRRPAVPPEDEPSQDTPRYVKGERVRHRRFGSGTIQGLTGTGRDLKVSVAFDDEEVGVKQLLVAYAGLEREWESA